MCVDVDIWRYRYRHEAGQKDMKTMVAEKGKQGKKRSHHLKVWFVFSDENSVLGSGGAHL